MAKDIVAFARGRMMAKKVVGKSALYKRAVKYRGTICEMCGVVEHLQLHHIDGNPANNAPENRMTLCWSCHTKWHWQHGKKAKRRKDALQAAS